MTKMGGGFAMLALIAASSGCKGDDTDSDDTDIGPPTGELTVVINEFQAANGNTYSDQSGAFPDWIEILNTTDALVDLSAWTLTDDPAQPQRWAFPEGTTLEGGARLIVFADGDPSLADELHASFSLSRTGETLQLVGPASEDLPIVDSVEFGIQFQDWSYARIPDGTGEWTDVEVPTPNAPND